ncbi:L,D-transpeptidase family protein [Bifidobacterium biavatii]|uniref:Peptidase n=1 Tax=Bifidobacterium biavatii DSM 23969 TaxID=1437608 RepID=A0A086ZN36_9BIFI|nr:L,D-transpeptidase family protein [Bifidobacterium biavatii]KFI47936.1 peptidase [Bifidobacterium biavatii DSM 23969]
MRLHLRRTIAAMIAAAGITTALAAAPTTAMATQPAEGSVDMQRLYNPNTGEHFYTANTVERDKLTAAGWSWEGIGWRAPVRSSTPVYRLYNAHSGDHQYTVNGNERDMLVRAGWRYEGIGWYSSDKNRAYPLYRQYNPRATTGSHNFTLNGNERDMLVRAGWRDEGVAWYGVGGATAAPTPQYLRPSGGAYPNLAAVANLNIEVSIAAQRVYVKSGNNTIYTMLASTGMNGTTPLGTFQVQNRGTSFYNASEGMGANYWVSFKDWGTYLFHTVPTDAQGRYIVSEANKLGRPASHGCVRLTVPDAKWLFDQLPQGTTVRIH